MLRILHLEDNALDRELIEHAMAAHGIKGETHWVNSRKTFVSILADVPVDLVLCDSGAPGFDGDEALVLVRQLQPEAVFVFVTGRCNEDIAKNLSLSGADGIVRKDKLAEMVHVLPRAFERQGATVRSEP